MIYFRDDCTKFLHCSLLVCSFVFNKRPNGWTDRAKILCGTSRNPREGLWMIEFFFIKTAKFFGLFLFYNVHKDKMFTIEIEDGAKRPKSLVSLNSWFLSIVCLFLSLPTINEYTYWRKQPRVCSLQRIYHCIYLLI